MTEGRIDNTQGSQIADALVGLLAAQSITLDFSPESLLMIDEILGAFGATGVKGNEGLIESIGAYYGEVLRRSLGGDWHFDLGDDGDWGLECPAGSGQMVWCAATVYKHFDRGGKSLTSLYDLLASGLDKPTIQRPEATKTSVKTSVKKTVVKKTAVKKTAVKMASVKKAAPAKKG